MANYSTLKHSKTLGETRISIFSTLASTLDYLSRKYLDLCRASAAVWIEAEVQFKSNPLPILRVRKGAPAPSQHSKFR
ncbi:hypothetical protein HDF11_004380 [Tunturiibacter psychrotolerans]